MKIITAQFNHDSSVISTVDEDGKRYGIPTGDLEAYDRFGLKEWIDDGNTPEPYVEPEPHWIDKRLANMADGGYGTTGEQFEMIGEQGMEVYQAHIAKVKTDIPKETS